MGDEVREHVVVALTKRSKHACGQGTHGQGQGRAAGCDQGRLMESRTCRCCPRHCRAPRRGARRGRSTAMATLHATQRPHQSRQQADHEWTLWRRQQRRQQHTITRCVLVEGRSLCACHFRNRQAAAGAVGNVGLQFKHAHRKSCHAVHGIMHACSIQSVWATTTCTWMMATILHTSQLGRSSAC